MSVLLNIEFKLVLKATENARSRSVTFLLLLVLLCNGTGTSAMARYTTRVTSRITENY